MKYTDLIKSAGKFDNMTEEQAVNYQLTNARELSAKDKSALEKRLRTTDPTDFRSPEFPYLEDAFKYALPEFYWPGRVLADSISDAEIEGYDKELGNLDSKQLIEYYKANAKSPDMTDTKTRYIQRRLGNLRRQEAERARYAKTQTPSYKQQFGPTGQAALKAPAADAENDTTAALDNRSWLEQNKNWLAGLGVGAAVGAGTYGALSYVPQLRRARLLRALAASVLGLTAGIGTSKWMEA